MEKIKKIEKDNMKIKRVKKVSKMAIKLVQDHECNIPIREIKVGYSLKK